ncbi:MAG: Asp-tRNA(Asn)/Glu-tRNA(Gln) amidotransferase subunit GatA [Spirochaetota bacterium]
MGLNELTIVGLKQKLKSKEVNVSEIIKDLKQAIDQDNHQSEPLNSYLYFHPQRIQEEAEQYIQNHPDYPDTLLGGVPIGVKDILNVEGQPTTCGSKILQGYISPYDATAVSNMRRQGGIPAGKLNMDEFGMGSSSELSAFGVVRNPYDRSRIPGGSSGGPASAVACNLAVAVLCSDTGGSIRQPASMCGVFGIKPTYGRVSRYGLVAYASSFDQPGPITKTVADGAVLLEAVSGNDPRDSTSAPQKVPQFSRYVGQSIKGLRVGVPDEYFGEGLHPQVRNQVEKGIEILRGAGASIKKISLKYTRYAVATYYIIATAEASSNLARYDGIRYGKNAVKTDNLEELYRENRSRGFGKEVKRRILLGTFTLSSGYYEEYYLKAQRARSLIRGEFSEAFRDIDIIATPVSPIPAWEIGKMVDNPLEMYLADAYTNPINLVGLPAASVNCGMTRDGLPVGIQLVADYFNEKDIFRAASVIEEEAK